MKRLVSIFAGLAMMVSVAVPQAFALTPNASASSTSVLVGETITLSVSATDLAAETDEASAMIYWGDSTTTSILKSECSVDTSTASASCVSASHSYASADTYTVTIYVYEYDADLGSSPTGYETTTVAVTVTEPLPDLVMQTVTYDPSYRDVTYTVANKGSANIDSSTAGLNQLSVVYTDGTTESQTHNWTVLSSSLTGFLTVGNSSDIHYYLSDSGKIIDSITVCADSINVMTGSEAVIESDETNNCSTLEFSYPDLLPTAIAVDEYGSLSYTIENQGDENIATGSVIEATIDITPPSSASYTLTDVPTTSSDLAFAGQGGSSTIATATLASYGIYTVEVCVDSTDQAAESNEDNNCITALVNYADPAVYYYDLGVDNLTYNYVFGDDYYYIGYTVSNLGTLDIDTSVYDGANICTINYLDGSSRSVSYSWQYSSLTEFLTAGGVSSDFSFSLSGEDVSTIDSVTICADGSYILAESDEDNNCNNIQIASDEEETPQSTFTVEAGSDQSVTLGTIVTVSALATNLDASATGITANINWNDGTLTHVIGSFDDASGVYLIDNHEYTAAGTYTVTVEATQYNNDSVEISTVSDSLTITVTETASSGGGSSGSSSTPTYGGGAGSSSSTSSSSSTTYGGGDQTETVEDEQDVIVTEDNTTTDVCAELPFTDVSPEASYYDAIYQAWCDGIVHGRTETLFAPEDAILRGEVAKVVVGVFGYSINSELTETSYSDLDASEPLAPYIQSLTDEGILQGYESDGTFKLDQAITVSEVDSILSRLGVTDSITEYSAGGYVTRGKFMEFILQYLY